MGYQKFWSSLTAVLDTTHEEFKGDINQVSRYLESEPDISINHQRPEFYHVGGDLKAILCYPEEPDRNYRIHIEYLPEGDLKRISDNLMDIIQNLNSLKSMEKIPGTIEKQS